MIEFARPWLLTLIPVGLALLWAAFRWLSSPDVWRRACDPELVPHLTTPPAHGTVRKLLAAAAIAVVLAFVALAGPGLAKEPGQSYTSNAATLVLIDLSRSMNAADLGASRLQVAKLKAIDLLRQAERRQAGQYGVIVYAGDAFLLAPLTDDVRTLEVLLRSADSTVVPVDGSRLSRALAMAERLLDSATPGSARIIVMADDLDDAATARARALRLERATVSVLGVGTPQGAPVPGSRGGFERVAGNLVLARLNESGLRELAAAGGGRYARVAADDSDLTGLLEPEGSGTNQADADFARAREALQFQDLGYWLVLCLLPLLALGFRRGWLVVLAAVTIRIEPAQAVDWDSWWQRPDQIAHQAIHAENYERAYRYATTPSARGAALYRQGDFDAAGEAYGEGHSAADRYNLGNALTHGGQYRAAIEAYGLALERDPQHGAARFNRDIARQLEALARANQQGTDGSGQPGGEPGSHSSEAEERQAQDAGAERASGQPEDPSGPAGASGQSSQAGDPQASQPPGADEEAPAADGRANSPEQAERASEQERAPHDDDTQDPDANRDGRERGPPGPSASELRALDQLLRAVPDDPAGLLRRKFRWQYQNRADAPGHAPKRW